MTHHKRPEVEKRLARIEGHVHGIRKMVEDGRSYSEITQQISATISALESVTQVIVDDLVEATISQAGKAEVRESVQELRDVIDRSS
ncbi:MAG TPA: metal-sensitive transcriptional regulator [Candidatus Acidoferrales bacterium]|nr:metal-sensitive transcriptional regulator [Candidatus Acidoferrales bacterium]